MSKRVFLVVMAWIVGLCIPSVMYGQATGSFSGTVTDKSGSVVAGAAVKVISGGTRASRESKTGHNGHYLIPFLPTAHYTLRVELSRFHTVAPRAARLH